MSQTNLANVVKLSLEQFDTKDTNDELSAGDLYLVESPVIIDEAHVVVEASKTYYHAILWSDGTLEIWGSFFKPTGSTSVKYAFPYIFSDNRIYVHVDVAYNNDDGGLGDEPCPLDGKSATGWGGSGSTISNDNKFHHGRCAYGFRLSTTSTANKQYHYYAKGPYSGKNLSTSSYFS